MSAVFQLLRKDWMRIRREPGGFLIQIALPLVITGVIGLAFGGGDDGPSVAAIPIAVVDEDDSLMGQLLKGAQDQEDFRENLELRFIDAQTATKQMKRNRVSAILTIPAGFSEAFLEGEAPPPLQLLKNPAQSDYPAIAQELLASMTELLDVVSRNFGETFAPWLDRLEEADRFDLLLLADMIVDLGHRLERAESYIDPLRLTYEVEEPSADEATTNDSSGFSVFGFLLPMLSSMFLLFIADIAMRDLHRERRQGLLNRYRTLPTRLSDYVYSKVFNAFTVCAAGGAIIFLGGSVIFQLRWTNPVQVALSIASYAFAAAGLLAFLVAVAKTERRSETINTLVVIAMAFVGGSFFMANSLPSFLQNGITPWMPNQWFIRAVQHLMFDYGDADWRLEALKLLGLGLALSVGASSILQRQLLKGDQR